jgi:hypothetical protein
VTEAGVVAAVVVSMDDVVSAVITVIGIVSHPEISNFRM